MTDTKDIERLAKVMGWRLAPYGPYSRATAFDDRTPMVVDRLTTLTDSGWRACVEWLLSNRVAFGRGRCDWWDGSTERGITFATPGNPTGDELMRAVLEVAGSLKE